MMKTIQKEGFPLKLVACQRLPNKQKTRKRPPKKRVPHQGKKVIHPNDGGNPSNATEIFHYKTKRKLR
jgi:hypothetical protein